ncbi:uncharacterized protein [Castor canadensis]|uniref:Uncharacterized protein n=1 Tax=Castor canadensis TaxID=51338 RepID=A0AC58MPP2_CASCN
MAPEKEMSHWGRSLNSGRLTIKEAGTLAAVLCPLCQDLGLPLPQADGSYAAGPMQYVHQPFTTTDLLNWQQHTPEYSEEPQPAEEPGQEWKSQANPDQPLKLTLTQGSADEAPDRPTDSTDSCNNSIAQARRQQMGPTGALDPDLLWPIQRLPIQCVWPSTVELGQLWGAFMVLSTTLVMCRFCLSEGLESAPPHQRPGCQYSEALFKPLQHETGFTCLVFLVLDLDILPGTEVARYVNQQADSQTHFRWDPIPLPVLLGVALEGATAMGATTLGLQQVQHSQLSEQIGLQ